MSVREMRDEKNESSDAEASDRPGEIRDQAHLEELLLAGLDSGPGIEATPEYWERKRETLLKRREVIGR